MDKILKLNNIQNNINDIYTKILLAKIKNDLIKNYELLDEFIKEEEKDILEKIKCESQTIIKDNINIFEKINLDLNQEYILIKKIDELLSDIIISLIINEKLENYDNIKYFILENIDITETIFDSLYKIFDTNKEYINKYIIKNKKDLLELKILIVKLIKS